MLYAYTAYRQSVDAISPLLSFFLACKRQQLACMLITSICVNNMQLTS